MCVYIYINIYRYQMLIIHNNSFILFMDINRLSSHQPILRTFSQSKSPFGAQSQWLHSGFTDRTTIPLATATWPASLASRATAPGTASKDDYDEHREGKGIMQQISGYLSSTSKASSHIIISYLIIAWAFRIHNDVHVVQKILISLSVMGLRASWSTACQNLRNSAVVVWCADLANLRAL